MRILEALWYGKRIDSLDISKNSILRNKNKEN